MLNPNDVHSDGDGEKQKAVLVDNSNLSVSEKKKLLWKDKVSNPYQGSELVKNIHGKTQSRHPK